MFKPVVTHELATDEIHQGLTIPSDPGQNHRHIATFSLYILATGEAAECCLDSLPPKGCLGPLR